MATARWFLAFWPFFEARGHPSERFEFRQAAFDQFSPLGIEVLVERMLARPERIVGTLVLAR